MSKSSAVSWYCLDGNMAKDVLDILYQLLASPSMAFTKMNKGRPLGGALLMAVFIAVVMALTMLPNPSQLLEVIFSMERGSLNPTLVLFIWVILFLVIIFVEGGIFHLVALLLRGRGSYLGMICGLCFAHFPFVFFAPLTLLRALLGSTGNILYPFVSLIFFFWILILEIIAIRQNYYLSTGRAVAAFFIPVIFLAILPLFIFIMCMAL